MRLATFNTLHGRSPADGRVDVDRFAEAVASLDADVLGLQEVDRDQQRSHRADLTAVAAEAMGAVAHRFVATVSGTPGGSWTPATGDEPPGTATYGVALLSRYPVTAWRLVRMLSIPVAFPMWLPGTRKVLLVREEPRAAVIATVAAPGGDVTVATTHLPFVPGWNSRQLRRIVRELESVPDPVVLLGDLNLRGDAPARITGWTAVPSGPTFPADRPRSRLDHVLVRGTPGTVTRVEVRQLPVSDHRALVVDLERHEDPEPPEDPEPREDPEPPA